MTKVPYFGHCFELLHATPQCGGAGFPVRFAAQKTSQLRNPTHRFAHCGTAFRDRSALMHITPKRLPLCGGQPVADRILRQFPRCLAQSQDAPSHYQIYRQGSLQPFSSFQLSLLHLTTAFEHLVNDFDLPALRIPPNPLNGLCPRGHWQRRQQLPHNSRGAFWWMDFLSLDSPQLQRRLLRFAFGSFELYGAETNVQTRQTARLISVPAHPYLQRGCHRLTRHFLPQRCRAIGKLAIVARPHQQLHSAPLRDAQCLNKQFIKVTFPISDIDQYRVRTQGCHRLAGSQTVDPFMTFFVDKLSPLATADPLAVTGTNRIEIGRAHV